MKTFTEMFADYFTNFDVLHQSLSPKFNRDMVFQAGEGAGRSGSFFFFSHDKKFIIKTIPKEELNEVLRLLPSLKEHFRTNPRSLLSKIFGVFTVKTKSMSDVHLMLQENILRFKNPANLKYVFDLKGSTVNREEIQLKPSTTLKDVNFLQESKANENFTQFEQSDRRALLRALHRDVEFLRQNGIMDYSLLLGIEETDASVNTDYLHSIDAPRYHIRRRVSMNDISSMQGSSSNFKRP